MNILVSNLSSNTISDDLSQLFCVYGQVSFVAIVRDKKSGRSKGMAFIEMPKEAEAIQAIAALNQLVFDDRTLIVQEIAYSAGEFNN